MTKGTKLTPEQRRVIDAVRKAGGVAHLRYEYRRPPGCVDSVYSYATIESLGKRGLIRYQASAGWVCVCWPDLEPEEPREHLMREWLGLVCDALRLLGGRAETHWELMGSRALAGRLTYGAMVDAVRYGHRKGRLTVGERLLGAEVKPTDDKSNGWFIQLAAE